MANPRRRSLRQTAVSGRPIPLPTPFSKRRMFRRLVRFTCCLHFKLLLYDAFAYVYVGLHQLTNERIRLVYPAGRGPLSPAPPPLSTRCLVESFFG